MSELSFEELRAVVFSDIRDFVTWGPQGVRLRPQVLDDPQKMKAVEHLAQTECSFHIKLWDKVAALGEVARRLGYAIPVNCRGIDATQGVCTRSTLHQTGMGSSQPSM